MASVTRFGLAIIAFVALGIFGPLTAVQQPSVSDRVLPEFDIRAGRALAAPPAAAVAALERARDQRGERGARINPHTGAIRVLETPAVSLLQSSPVSAVRSLVASLAEDLALDPADLADLRSVHDYVSASTGLRHVAFAQSIDGIPVFEGILTVHVQPDGSIARVTSNAARAEGRQGDTRIPAARATAVAATDVPRPLRQSVVAGQVWFPMDGALRLAWHVVIEPQGPAIYDVIVDALDGQLLLRRNRVRYSDGTGRVLQSAATYLLDPRLPDQMPLGADGPGGCPPPVNHLPRSLNAPFRDPATVLFNTGRLSGNNTHVYRSSAPNEGALGTFDGAAWAFDFPFNSASSAETALFFAMNFVHDFFYGLGFDEAAGNFQVDNFGRGGLGGDPLSALARAEGRNNAYYQHAPDGSSATIAMFLWDGTGCWEQDVDGDGTLDLDGDYDTDIVIHEFHHGVSLRLNTAWSGDEAGAIGEGGGDFFAYSVNGDTILADYSRPGGIRSINGKSYADWTCLFFFFCSPHSNGEIWANVLWDVRERFRTDLVRGSEAAAINESHQLYVDALKLSPPAPTMLDMRDAMLLADSLRNPGAPRSENFCRLWESFAARGMGENATDTADNGLNQVGPDSSVPDGCQAPPVPPTVTLAVVVATATEAGPGNGMFRISRSEANSQPLTVDYSIAGTATNGTDYVTLSGSATIPGDATSVDVTLTPIDDTVYESNETVLLTLRANSSYVVGSPGSGTVTIVSDDLAPDFIVTALTVTPSKTSAGGTIVVTDTTKNQGTGAAPVSWTSYYLSKNTVLDTTDALLGSREVLELASGGTNSGSLTLILPDPLDAGSYTLIAKADGPDSILESQETNNKRTATLQIGPDLAITAVSAPSSAAAGATILASDTTINQGSSAAAGSTTRFYLSTNGALDASDVALQGRSVPALDVNISSAATTNVTIPASTVTGLYYLIAKADAEDIVAESVETNNTRYARVWIGPDLSISSISGPGKAASGGSITVTETTKNVGAGPAPASTTALYLSTNASWNTSDVRLSTGRTVPPLDGSATSTASTTVVLPEVAAGTWYLLARADDELAVVETQENNNVGYTALKIGPDLTIPSMSVPSPSVAGSTIVVTHTVQNTGGQDAGRSFIKFYLSTNSTFDAGDVDLGTSNEITLVPAGGSVAGSTALTLPSGLSGTFYLFAFADGTNLVPETSEGNNRTYRSFKITLPTSP